MSYNLPNLPTNFDSKRNKILWDNILYAMAQIARRKYANQPKELNAAINAINNTRNQLGRIDDAKLLAATDALMNQLGGSEKKNPYTGETLLQKMGKEMLDLIAANVKSLRSLGLPNEVLAALNDLASVSQLVKDMLDSYAKEVSGCDYNELFGNNSSFDADDPNFCMNFNDRIEAILRSNVSMSDTLDPSSYDPLVLDLNHNGTIDTVQIYDSNAFFDIDGNDKGIREHVSWIENGDGFLVQDLNNNGNIDGISELFGNFTTNAFDDLKARIDSNNDGIIDANDDLFHTLQVWIDKNGNGTTEEGELYSLESLGITSIDTNKTLHTIWDGTNNIVNSTSTYTQDGEQQLAGGMNFEVDQTVTKSEGPIAIEDLFNPILRGFGDVKDSIVVMHENPDFRSLIKEMAAGIQ